MEKIFEKYLKSLPAFSADFEAAAGSHKCLYDVLTTLGPYVNDLSSDKSPIPFQNGFSIFLYLVSVYVKNGIKSTKLNATDLRKEIASVVGQVKKDYDAYLKNRKEEEKKKETTSKKILLPTEQDKLDKSEEINPTELAKKIEDETRVLELLYDHPAAKDALEQGTYMNFLLKEYLFTKFFSTGESAESKYVRYRLTFLGLGIYFDCPQKDGDVNLLDPFFIIPSFYTEPAKRRMRYKYQDIEKISQNKDYDVNIRAFNHTISSLGEVKSQAKTFRQKLRNMVSSSFRIETANINLFNMLKVIEKNDSAFYNRDSADLDVLYIKFSQKSPLSDKVPEYLCLLAFDVFSDVLYSAIQQRYGKVKRGSRFKLKQQSGKVFYVERALTGTEVSENRIPVLLLSEVKATEPPIKFLDFGDEQSEKDLMVSGADELMKYGIEWDTLNENSLYNLQKECMMYDKSKCEKLLKKHQKLKDEEFYIQADRKGDDDRPVDEYGQQVKKLKKYRVLMKDPRDPEGTSKLNQGLYKYVSATRNNFRTEDVSYDNLVEWASKLGLSYINSQMTKEALATAIRDKLYEMQQLEKKQQKDQEDMNEFL